MLGLKKNLVSSFDYIYMFIMVLNMGQLDRATSRMVGGISGDPISFIIPILSSLIFVRKHNIKFYDKQLIYILLIFLSWSIAVIVKMSLYSTQELSYYFFLFYAIVVAFIHVKGYGESFFPCFEEVIVLFCKIALIGWAFCNILPNFASSFMHQFPETGYGNNFFYIFNWMDPSKVQAYRNAGLSWEPGRFAIMIIMAIIVNLSREGIKFKKNSNIFWLLSSLATTMSTTGYITVIVLYSIFWMKEWTYRNTLSYCVIIIPIIYALVSFDFMGEKIKEQIDLQNRLEETMVSVDYANSNGEDEWICSLDRFESIYLEAMINIPNDPLLGYGKNTENSYYSLNVSKSFTLSGGLLKIIGQFGIPFGILLYYILYRSSVVYAKRNQCGKDIAVFLAILLSSVSYVIFCIPIFTTFWLYGIFIEKGKTSFNN